MNEFEARDYIIQKGKGIKSLDELKDLIAEVRDNFNYDYGVTPRCIGAVTSVVANYLSREMGITGFQAGCAMFDFIRAFNYSSNKCGLRIINYDDMLYPQYEERFSKTINENTWSALQEEAKKSLVSEDYSLVHPNVIRHWQSIANGIVPFGYQVEK